MTNKQQLEQDDQHCNWTDLDFKKEFPDLFAQLMVIEKAKWKKSDKEDQELFVLLHGWIHNPDNLKSIAKTISDLEFHDPIILVPKLPTEFFSFAKPEIIAGDIVLIIDYLYKKYQFKDIYLIGHSLGSLIARKVYLYAYGEVKNQKDGTIKAPFENIKDIDKFKKQKNWVKKVNRIILLAGMNKGWSTVIMPKYFVLLGTDFITFLDTVFYGIVKHFLIFKIRYNSSFITNLRLQWITMSNSLIENPEKEVLIIQLLGTKDDLVSPEDNIDFATGKTFLYMQVPKSTHNNIINMNYKDRKELFKKALICDKKDVLNENYQDSDFFKISDLQDRALQQSNKDIKNVVFVIHGIRDEGFWMKKIAWTVQKLANEKQSESWKTETSTYGYFGMIPFLSPYLRRNKVEWLMNQYIENLALYPCAYFHCVAHSNGSYLVAKALQEYPCCRFKHIVFAGSVVPCNYPWQEKINSTNNQQVAKVLNFVATADWAVGIFPHIFEYLSSHEDLGGAGYKGFKGLSQKPNSSNQSDDFIYETNKQKTIHQLKYITGDHGAALKEENWDLIANFIVNGTVSFEKEIFCLEEEVIEEKATNPNRDKMPRIIRSIAQILKPLLNQLSRLLKLLGFIKENQTPKKLWKKDQNPCVKILSEFPLITWLVLLTIVISIGFIAYFIIFNLLAISILAKTVLITIFIIFYLFVLYMFLTRF